MARKLEVSVVSTVVGGRRDARGRFRGGLRAAADDDEPGAGCRGSREVVVVTGKKELVAPGSRKSCWWWWSSRKADAVAAGEDGWLSLAVDAMGGSEGVRNGMEM
jgi:hypothetical protein